MRASQHPPISTIPALGAIMDPGGTTFRAWSPPTRRAEVRLFTDAQSAVASYPLRPSENGHFELRLTGRGPGTLYKFEVPIFRRAERIRRDRALRVCEQPDLCSA